MVLVEDRAAPEGAYPGGEVTPVRVGLPVHNRVDVHGPAVGVFVLQPLRELFDTLAHVPLGDEGL